MDKNVRVYLFTYILPEWFRIWGLGFFRRIAAPTRTSGSRCSMYPEALKFLYKVGLGV